MHADLHLGQAGPTGAGAHHVRYPSRQMQLLSGSTATITVFAPDGELAPGLFQNSSLQGPRILQGRRMKLFHKVNSGHQRKGTRVRYCLD